MLQDFLEGYYLELAVKDLQLVGHLEEEVEQVVVGGAPGGGGPPGGGPG